MKTDFESVLSQLRICDALGWPVGASVWNAMCTYIRHDEEMSDLCDMPNDRLAKLIDLGVKERLEWAVNKVAQVGRIG